MLLSGNPIHSSRQQLIAACARPDAPTRTSRLLKPGLTTAAATHTDDAPGGCMHAKLTQASKLKLSPYAQPRIKPGHDAEALGPVLITEHGRRRLQFNARVECVRLPDAGGWLPVVVCCLRWPPSSTLPVSACSSLALRCLRPMCLCMHEREGGGGGEREFVCVCIDNLSLSLRTVAGARQRVAGLKQAARPTQ